MKQALFIFALLAQWILMTSAVAAGDTFPGRSEYPDVATFEIEQLDKDFKNVVIVDTRSSYEFETLHVKSAVNIPVADKTFANQVKALRAKSDKPIVFYCNGRSCFKSYRAVKEAKRANVDNTYAYDAGMFEWARAYPEKSVLLGKSPINPDDIISAEKYKSRLLDPETFSKQVFDNSGNAVVLDVRDMYQRAAGIGFFIGRENWVSLDNKSKLIEYINKAVSENKTLYIYDEVGKQVRWLQYALEKSNAKRYYFMNKGARGYMDNIVFGGRHNGI